MELSVVVPAAGSGSRFGGEVPKQFASLAGRPLIAHTLGRLESHSAVKAIVVATAAKHVDTLESILFEQGLTKTRVVTGGSTRAESVLMGLSALGSLPADSFVAIHDAVRPFVSIGLIDRLIAALGGCDGSFPGIAPTDTIHGVENGIVVETTDRANLIAAQTPQCFRLGVVREALEDALRNGHAATDEVAAVVRLGYRVAVVEGDEDNMKITRAEDMKRAEQILAGKGA